MWYIRSSSIEFFNSKEQDFKTSNVLATAREDRAEFEKDPVDEGLLYKTD